MILVYITISGLKSQLERNAKIPAPSLSFLLKMYNVGVKESSEKPDESIRKAKAATEQSLLVFARHEYDLSVIRTGGDMGYENFEDYFKDKREELEGKYKEKTEQSLKENKNKLS